MARFGVYVHIPFCASKCDYCAFATWTDRSHLVNSYVSALRTEIGRAVADAMPVVDTVFVECGAAYDRTADDAFAPVGETAFVTAQAERSERRVMGGIVAHADLRDASSLDAVLDAHDTAGNGRFRGIRHAGSHALHPEVLTIPGRAPFGLYADPAFRTGVARLGERGLTYDTWHYHYQNRDFLELARAVPGTTMVLDHFGTPLGVGPYESQREQILQH